MIDFHAHILPNVDDGPSEMEESLSMLRWSFLQGVDVVVSTSHFYAYEEYPHRFLERRNGAYQALQDAMRQCPGAYPEVVLGAEVLYFPGISDAEEMESLMIGSSRSILIEPPMAPWSNGMLDEIVRLGENFRCVPVIAHVDRYMQLLRDRRLMDRVRERDLLVQVNAAYFLNPKTRRAAIKHLKKGNIQLVGSDCHHLESRAPNLGPAWNQAKAQGAAAEFMALSRNAEALLRGESQWERN